MNDAKYYELLIIDELTGNTGGDPNPELAAWIGENPATRKLYEAYRQAWTLADLNREDSGFATAREKENFRKKIRRSKISGIIRRAGVAAALAILVGSSFFTYRYFAARRYFDEGMTAVISAPQGNKSHAMLPDGSSVWLNADSHLYIEGGFGAKERTVRLEGEGYFEVTSDRRPFTVLLDDFRIRVHGTSFNIKSYANDNEKKVTLIEGSVSLELEDGRSYSMHPDDVAVWDRACSQFTIYENRSNRSLTWLQGNVSFEGTEFGDILNELERKFGVAFRVENPHVANKRLAGEFSSDESIRVILEVLSATGNFSYRIDDKMITIY